MRLPALLLTLLAACSGAPGTSEGRLLAAEQQLARSFGNRGIRISLPTPDTLLVHVPVRRDIVRSSRRVLTNTDSASRLVAQRALAVTDSSGTAQITVVVELSRSRQLGPFVWGAGSTRAAYSAAELRARPPELPAASAALP